MLVDDLVLQLICVDECEVYKLLRTNLEVEYKIMF